MISHDSFPMNNSPVTAEENGGVTEKSIQENGGVTEKSIFLSPSTKKISGINLLCMRNLW